MLCLTEGPTASGGRGVLLTICKSCPLRMASLHHASAGSLLMHVAARIHGAAGPRVVHTRLYDSRPSRSGSQHNGPTPYFLSYCDEQVDLRICRFLLCSASRGRQVPETRLLGCRNTDGCMADSTIEGAVNIEVQCTCALSTLLCVRLIALPPLVREEKQY